MKKLLIGTSIIVVIIIIGYLVPQISIHQETYEDRNLNESISCSIEVVKKHLSPMEKLITTKITIGLGGYFNTANVYTLFGIRYADADVTCDEDPFQLVRYWW
jgi:hypothetical protein